MTRRFLKIYDLSFHHMFSYNLDLLICSFLHQRYVRIIFILNPTRSLHVRIMFIDLLRDFYFFYTQY